MVGVFVAFIRVVCGRTIYMPISSGRVVQLPYARCSCTYSIVKISHNPPVCFLFFAADRRLILDDSLKKTLYSCHWNLKLHYKIVD